MIFPYKTYVVELDGQIFQYTEGRLTPIQRYHDLPGDCLLITDLQEGVAKTMTVEAPIRYVELMVRRRLQESGEFEEPVTILTHWKKPRGKNTSDIFFTAVPTRLHLYYTEQLGESSNSVVVFPIYTLLYNTLAHLRSRKPVALVFQHGRFADLLIGTHKRIYYAIRCTAFDVSHEQLLALWETVRGEIRMVADEHRINITRIHLLDWIDSGPLPQWDEEAGLDVMPLDGGELFLEETVLSTSFFSAASNLSTFQSISKFKEKLFYATTAWAPALALLVLIMATGFWGSGIYLSGRSETLGAQTKALEREYNEIRSEIPVLSPAQDYRPTLDFVKELAAFKKMPDYKQVIADLSEAMSTGMTLEILKLTYTADELQLELFGPIKVPFNQAHVDYQRFLKIIGQKGYIVTESRFDTVIDESQILVRLKKRWV